MSASENSNSGSERREGRKYTALISLVAGLAFCLPPAPFAAFGFGVAALRSGKPQIGGRAAAWTGILLSLAGFVFLSCLAYSSFWLSAPARHFTEAFIQDLSEGRTDLAAMKCDSEITVEDIELWESQVQKIEGPLQIECTSPLFQSDIRGSQRRLAHTLAATVRGPRGQSVTFSLALLRSGGVFRLWNFHND